jgi:antibiotic biosynthesis monooxygenase (ABM) superfamily enzyme
MICRIWHGWTTPEKAEAYEHLLREEVFSAISARAIAGYLGIELLRRVEGDEVAFVTLMWFESLASVRAFAGADYEQAVVPGAARALLNRYDAQSTHYEIRVPGPAANATSRPAV